MRFDPGAVVPIGPSPKGVDRPRSFAPQKSVQLVNSGKPGRKPGSSWDPRRHDPSLMSMSSTDKGLLTPDNCAIIFIDHQPQMFFDGAEMDWADLLQNVLLLAKAAKMFGVPVILTAVESGEFNGRIAPQLLALFPDQPVIRRSSMNAWDDPCFAAAVILSHGLSAQKSHWPRIAQNNYLLKIIIC